MSAVIRLSLLESLRRQIHLILLFLAVGILIEPAIINAFNMATPERVIKDIALTLMGLYGVGLSLFLSCSAVPREIKKHTIYPLLARPISRLQYLISKFLSIGIIVVVSQFLLGSCMVFSLWVFLKQTDMRIFIGAGSICLEDLVLTAAGIFFSTMASPVLAAVLGVFAYLVGGLSPAFINFFLNDPGSRFTALLARGFKFLLPQFDFFQIKDAIVHNEALNGAFLTATTLYGLTWIFLLLLMAGLVFDRKDL